MSHLNMTTEQQALATDAAFCAITRKDKYVSVEAGQKHSAATISESLRAGLVHYAVQHPAQADTYVNLVIGPALQWLLEQVLKLSKDGVYNHLKANDIEFSYGEPIGHLRRKVFSDLLKEM